LSELRGLGRRVADDYDVNPSLNIGDDKIVFNSSSKQEEKGQTPTSPLFCSTQTVSGFNDAHP
jgi:hypothetical protein